MRALLAACVSFAVLVGSQVHAAPGAYTDPTSFAANVAGGTATFDFESLAPGTSLSATTQTPSGASAGIVLPPALADVLDPGGPSLDLEVVEGTDNPTSSGARSMGVDDTGNFDAITAGSPLAFTTSEPVGAFGLTLVTPEEPDQALFDGDARLVVPGEATASLSLADSALLGTFNGREYRAYFLGVVGAASFSSATLEFDAGTPVSAFFFNLDDLVIPVPEPGTNAAIATGCALLLALSRHREVRRKRR